MNNTGQYNRRITHFNQGISTSDGMGGFTYGTPTSTEVWCKARQLSMSQKFNYGFESGTVTYKFSFKYLTAYEFTFDDWFTYNGNKYIISDISDTEDSEQEIVIIAKKSLNE